MRWDGDSVGHGVADASAFASGADELVEAMREPQWVAEQPEVHLLPHLAEACRDSPFELVPTHLADDGSFEVELAWRGESDAVGAVRRAVYALVGSFAEPATYIRQRRSDGLLVFEVVTGLIGSDAHFTPHGHSIRLRVAGAGT
jgi:hypothetical protein